MRPIRLFSHETKQNSLSLGCSRSRCDRPDEWMNECVDINDQSLLTETSTLTARITSLAKRNEKTMMRSLVNLKRYPHKTWLRSAATSRLMHHTIFASTTTSIPTEKDNPSIMTMMSLSSSSQQHRNVHHTAMRTLSTTATSSSPSSWLLIRNRSMTLNNSTISTTSTSRRWKSTSSTSSSSYHIEASNAARSDCTTLTVTG